MKRRIVITGMGMISPLGNTVEESWKNLLAGKSGVQLIQSFDVSAYDTKISGSIKNFDPLTVLNSKEVRRNDLFVQYGLVAADQAIKDAQLVSTEETAHRIGISIGSGIGGMSFIEKSHDLLVKEGPQKLSPFFIPGIIINMVDGCVSIRHGFKGPSITAVTACATGAHCIGLAYRLLMYGDADVMVCGGAEMGTCPLSLGGFGAMKALSVRNNEPEKASRPWDKDRDGFVIGDGAGVLVLETLESAQRRGAKIYGEIIGFGMSSDAYHITAPHPEGEGGMAAMKNALADAQIPATTVDYVKAHGTSTPLGDELEVKAIKRTFGDHAYKLCVSAPKSMTGHLLGAAGAVESIFSILALRDQIVPPTINLDNPSEGCDLNFVPHKAQEHKLNVVLANSFGFGGTNASLIFKKFNG